MHIQRNPVASRARPEPQASADPPLYVIPHKVEIEKAVLGAMMLTASAIPKVKRLLPDYQMMHTGQHRRIYRCILELQDAGTPVDQVLVVQRLTAHGWLDDVGGAPYIAELASGVVSAHNVEYHAGILLDYWRRRTALQEIEQRRARLLDEGEDVTSVVDDMQSALQMVQSVAEHSGLGDRRAYRGTTILERRREGILRRIRMSPIVTGYSALDRKLIQPFFPGGLTAIAARPSVGKSTVKANLTVNLCEAGFGVCSATPEQGFDREMDRLDSIYTGIPLADIKGVREWKPGDPRVKKLLSTNGDIYSKAWNFCLMPRSDIAWADIEAQVVADAYEGHQTHVVFVDLMDWLTDVSRVSDKPEAITHTLRRASAFAKRMHLHVVMLAQINRDARLNDDGRPSLNTIKGSGGWEETCDNVLLLHQEVEDQLDIIIAKQRDGEGGDSVVVRLPFDKTTLTIGNRDYRNVHDPKGYSSLHLRKAV